jgi:hypothetical protein
MKGILTNTAKERFRTFAVLVGSCPRLALDVYRKCVFDSSLSSIEFPFD